MPELDFDIHLFMFGLGFTTMLFGVDSLFMPRGMTTITSVAAIIGGIFMMILGRDALKHLNEVEQDAE